MLLFLRKILFYLLVLLYFFAVPCAILYALGYILNPTHISLVKTGVLSIESYPKYATISVEGKRFFLKTPTVVNGLLPGSYRIRLSRKGFNSWEKTIEIEEEKATQLESVLLIPQKPERDFISTRSFTNMIPGILEAKLFAWENETLDSLWKVDLFFRKETPLGNEINAPLGIKIINGFYQEKLPLALLQVQEAGKRRFLVLESGQEKKMMQRLHNWIPEDPDWISWDPKDAYQIYFLKNGNLSRIDLRHDKFYPNITTNIWGFGVRGNHLYLLKKDYALVETDRTVEKESSLLESQDLGQKIFSQMQARYFRIEVFDRDLLIFLSDEGALMSNRLPYYHVDRGVQGIQRAQHADNEKVLFWNSHEIGVIDFTREKDKVFEREPEKTLLYENAREIHQAFWAYEDTHIIFLDEDRVYLLETKGPQPHLLREIEQVKPGSLIYYNDRDHNLYYLDASSGRLVKRRLIE